MSVAPSTSTSHVIADGKSSSKQDSNSTDDADDDRKAQAMALRSAMKGLASLSSTGDEGPPLTTKALRDLERIKKEIIFNETLIKIRYIMSTNC